jgi:uracil-DNA glycosylase
MTEAKILSFSPDEPSSKNAKTLANRSKWEHVGAFDGDEGEVVWGEIKGSDGTIYHTRVGVDSFEFKCSCPSRKRPCKHALALGILRADDASVFRDAPPAWVLSDETPRPAFANKTEGDSPASGPSNEPIQPLEIPAAWKPLLEAETQKSYWPKLVEFVEEERRSATVYPPSGQEFAALEAVAPDEVKVLILGQDPYHGPKQAHGMAFSVQAGVNPPPSLQNIFLEMSEELGVPVPKTGYLMPWAKQGVLLLNAVLTVRRSEPNSHKSKGWEKFTDSIIKSVSDKEDGVVFVLWGAYAQKKEKLIDTSKHAIVKSAHPSPLSAHVGFFGSEPFSQINAALERMGRGAVDWKL